MTILFCLFVALDLAAVGLFLLLGLAAAKPSHTNPLAVVGLALVLLLVLVGLVALYFRAGSAALRIVAFAVVGAAPVVLLASAGLSSLVAWRMGESAEVRPGGAVDAGGPDGLVQALRQLEKTPEQPEAFRALLQAGANPNGGNASPLELAIRLSPRIGREPVDLLLAAKANPNARPGSQPVYFAAVGKKVDRAVLLALLDGGADLKAVDMAGSNALYWAVYAGNWRAALELLERGIEWRQVRMLNGQSVLTVLEAEIRRLGEGEGRGEVLRFLRSH